MTIESKANGKVTVNPGKCPSCGKPNKSLVLPEKGMKEWMNGELIQRALPELSSEDRETLISRICPSCQKDFFEEED